MLKASEIPLENCCAVIISSPIPVQFTKETSQIKIQTQAHQTRGEVLNPHCFTTGPPMVRVTASPGRTTHPSFVLHEAISSPVGLCTAASMGPTLAQQSGMHEARRHSVTVSDGEVLTASGSFTTCSTVHLEIHQAFWTGPMEKSSPPCHPIPGPRDTVMFLHQWPPTMGERSVPVQGRKGRARRKPRKGGKVCVTPRRFLSPPLTNGSSHNSLPTQTRSSTNFFFSISPLRPHVVTGV